MDIISLQVSLTTLLADVPGVQQVYGQWAKHGAVQLDYPYIGQQMQVKNDDLDNRSRQLIIYTVHVWGLTPDSVLSINQGVYDLLHRNHCAIEGLSSIVHTDTSPILPESNNTLFHCVLTFNITTRF